MRVARKRVKARCVPAVDGLRRIGLCGGDLRNRRALAATEVVAKTDLLVLTPKVGAVAVGDTTDVTWMPLPETLQREAIANAVLVWTEENHRDPTNIWLREHIKSWAKAMLERCDAR